ncbi:MAG: PHP domain-containing protein [Alphaproteobacteria bacterium]|nr:PHP domain-containing protein [Alphaproteobacteria bacterium]
MSDQFVHLRVHSKVSVGASTLSVGSNPKIGVLKGIPELCKDNNMFACALTDTNMMSGCAELSDVMPANKLQPIIGVELSLNHHNADPKILRQSSLSKIVLLAKHHQGYLNLCELSYVMYMRQENHHLGPYITMEELEKYKDDLICLSGAHTGPLGMSILNKQTDLATDLAKRFLDIFGNNFYIEIQRHGLADEIKTEPVFLQIARDLNIPIVATNDVCFALPEDYESMDALSCVLGQTKVIDPDRPRKSCEQYFKSAEEMAEIFSDLPEAIENTVNIAKRCAFYVNVHEKPLLPRFGNDLETE